jgi:Protein of unknown function (DUF998)
MGTLKNIERVLAHILGVLDAFGILAMAGMVGPLVLVALDIAAAVSEPKYSLIRDSISALGLTSLGWIQTIGFVVFGLLVEIFTAGLFLNIRRKHLFDLGIGLLTFFGFGLALIGLFRTNPIGGLPTLSGRIHVWAAYSVLGLFPVALALLLSSIRDDPNWRGFFHYTIVSGILALALAVGRLFLPQNISWFGLYERILVANVLVWLEITGIRLLFLSIRRKPNRLIILLRRHYR